MRLATPLFYRCYLIKTLLVFAALKWGIKPHLQHFLKGQFPMRFAAQAQDIAVLVGGGKAG
jgi:hypothetical protein